MLLGLAVGSFESHVKGILDSAGRGLLAPVVKQFADVFGISPFRLFPGDPSMDEDGLTLEALLLLPSCCVSV